MQFPEILQWDLEDKKMYIIPQPQKITIYDEKVKVNSVCVIVDSEEIYKFFEGDGEFKVEFENDISLSKEHYKISVTKEKIKILYGDLKGAYRAYTTLKQIISQGENGEIPLLEIEDYPAIKNRGYMLDISRGKIPKLSHLKYLVDILSDLKYNELQLYMDSFVYEYKNFPEYWKDTEPLKVEEIKELDKYCKERFISLVPNQNGFGHMDKWTAKKELSHLAITGKDGKPSATLNPFLDGSIELLDKIYDGFFDSFSSDFVNIGMDEPFELGLNETKEQCEKLGVGKVFTDYLNKVCRLISEKYGKIPMFWDDVIFKHEEEIDNIPKNAIVMQWGYEAEQHFDRNCRMLKDRGLKFYVCPGTSMWGTYTGRTNNAIINMTSAAECGNYYGAEGYLLTEWGDGGNPQFPATTMFPLVYGGAVSWNCMDSNTEKAYEQRRKLIKDCRKYTDKYIYKCEGEVSLSDIVCRMGNYYLLEDLLQFNRAETRCFIKEDIPVTDDNKKAFLRVRKYMLELRNELKKVKADETAISEIKCNCDMVILFAGLLSGEKNDYEKETEDMILEFKRLWDLKNKTVGKDEFIDFTYKALKKYY